MDTIPLVDLAAQHREVAAEVADGWARVLADTAFVGGPQVEAFESAFAAHHGRAHAVGVANGTDAIELALRALGIGAGDECILPANTFIATAEAVARIGAVPVVVDCDPVHHLLDPAATAAAVGPRTRALLPVHLYGQLAPVEILRPLADAVGAVVVEDAAQAQGARRLGEPLGTYGHAVATSFYPGKNLGAYGDAGAVMTDDAGVAEAARVLSRHGSPRKYEHVVAGMNSRLDTLQAVVLSAKLPRLDGWNRARRVAAGRYADLLADVPGVILPATMPGNEHVWHLYVVRVPERDRVLAELNRAGIGAGIHYPTPVHRSPAFAAPGTCRTGPGGSCPVAERLADEILTLPLFPHITAAQQERVAGELRVALTRCAPAALDALYGLVTA